MSNASLVVYVNGEYVPKDHARISIFDFGFFHYCPAFGKLDCPVLAAGGGRAR